MEFKRITITPKGRNKYGSYLSIGNVNQNLISYSNNGNGTATGLTTNNTTLPSINTKTYSLSLNKNTFTFQWNNIVEKTTEEDIIQVIGYADLDLIPTFVGDFQKVIIDTDFIKNLTDEEKDEYIQTLLKNSNYGIQGLETGMDVEVLNNGTQNTIIKIKVNKNINVKNGTLYIPCHLYTGSEELKPAPGDFSDWYDSISTTKYSLLEYNFNIINNDKGSSIRGPYDYANLTPINGRRWCNGIFTDPNYPEDGQFLDIIKYGNSYYFCKISYTSNERDWDDAIDNVIRYYWQKSDVNYDFIATNLLLAENAKIAGFTFTNNKLVSEVTNADGSPSLSLDGLNGVIEANKGSFKGSIYQNFKSISEANLSIEQTNIILQQAEPTNLYLPKITDDIIGIKYCVFFFGIATRMPIEVQKLYANSSDYIVDFECTSKDGFGTPIAINSIWSPLGYWGYVELIAQKITGSSNGYWIMTNVSAPYLHVSTSSSNDITLKTLRTLSNN